jgi:uncharacterized membrane protein
MENKKVGLLILGIATAVSIIVLIFNTSLKSITKATCTHGPECSMYTTINSQFWLSFSIIGIIVSIGLYILFSKPQEKIIEKTIIKRIKQKNKINLSGLNEKEKKAIKIIQKENGAIFQADLKEKLEIGKVGITRLLDKLEAKQLIERKRRGMNNIVVLK